MAPGEQNPKKPLMRIIKRVAEIAGLPLPTGSGSNGTGSGSPGNSNWCHDHLLRQNSTSDSRSSTSSINGDGNGTSVSVHIFDRRVLHWLASKDILLIPDTNSDEFRQVYFDSFIWCTSLLHRKARNSNVHGSG